MVSFSILIKNEHTHFIFSPFYFVVYSYGPIIIKINTFSPLNGYWVQALSGPLVFDPSLAHLLGTPPHWLTFHTKFGPQHFLCPTFPPCYQSWCCHKDFPDSWTYISWWMGQTNYRRGKRYLYLYLYGYCTEPQYWVKRAGTDGIANVVWGTQIITTESQKPQELRN